MYATCLFCHSPLGTNDAIEHFPVGQCLAFDAAKGRLWVVCAKCDRWNLSPLETRWEAIEEAERSYRAAKQRVSTDNIGLAKLNDGTFLIRIGAPLRPEFAAWRYGDQFGKRYRTRLAVGGGLVTIATGIGAAVGITGLAGGALGLATLPFISMVWRRMRVPPVRDEHGQLYRLSRMQAEFMTIRTGVLESGVSLQFGGAPLSQKKLGVLATFRREVISNAKFDPENASEPVVLNGAVAMQALSTLLPSLNASGGSPKSMASAVKLIESVPSPTTLLLNLRRVPNRPVIRHVFPDGVTLRASNIPAPARLALEMSLHEEDERRALEGELHVLEQRWKDAEEIANIADSLTLPEGMSAELEALRSKSRNGPTDS